MSEEVQLLDGKSDRFSGITVDSTRFAATSELFDRQLERSLAAWREAKRRGIWLSIPANRTELIPVAQKHGFVLHHARTDYVMLTHWLDQHEPNQLPSYAMITIGVGGLVVNKERQVLLIQERFPCLADFWKLPGGSLNIGESIEEGVRREVFEETGIRARFRGVLTFTFEKDFRYGLCDIYFVCLMKLDDEEQMINVDPLEIAQCQWMSLDGWANSPEEEHPLQITLDFARTAIDVLDGREQCLQGDRIEVKSPHFDQPPCDVMMYRKKSIDIVH